MDHTFLDQLYRQYSRSVFRRARVLLGDRDAAKDAMQEVFLRAMHARVELTSEPSRMSWLYRVTTNLCLNRLRDSGRRRTLLQALPSAPEAAPGYPLDSALTVRAILRQLPVEVQEIAVYYFVDQMTQEEIAAVTGLERRTVGNRLEAFRTQALAAASSGGGAA